MDELGSPQNILLATDLASDSDRALDRAAQLAVQWQATLHVVHALRPETEGFWWPADSDEPQSRDREVAMVEQQIRRDLREKVPDLVIHVASGEPARVILEVAEREQCGLVVLGASGPAFAGVEIATTTAQLMRRSAQSLLIVKLRPHEPYRKVLVGTDFTAESRRGLEAAAAWFPDAGFELMHVLDIPYKSLLLEVGREHEFARMERDTMAAFVAAARIPASIGTAMRTQIEYGHAEVMMRRHAIAREVDLTVIGALTRGLAFHMLVGGNGARIVRTVPSDVLMVRAAAPEHQPMA